VGICVVYDGLVGYGFECFVGEFEFDVVDFEYLYVLFRQCVVRLGEDVDECFVVEV